MFNKVTANFSGILDYIPILLFLGILAGYGAHIAVIGALITTACFCAFNPKSPFLYGATLAYALSLAGANMFLGGKSDTLYALVFLSGILTVIWSCLNIKKKNVFDIPKSVSSGFLTGCYACGFILTIPVIFGNVTYTTTNLLFNSKNHPFAITDTNCMIIFFTILAVYYCLSGHMRKTLPISFISLIAGCLVNFIYKMNLPCVDAGFEFFKPVATADFGNFISLMIFSFLVSLVIVAQVAGSEKMFNKQNKTKKTLLICGISNIASSITGSIGSLANIEFNKRKYNYPAIELILLLLLFVLYPKISPLIPIVAAASILTIKCYEKIKQSIFAQKNKTRGQKALFAICLISTVYNILLGIIFCAIFTLINKRKAKSTGLH